MSAWIDLNFGNPSNFQVLTLASVTPLLGLLVGTVIGMIEVFGVIMKAGVGNLGVLAGGISKALITIDRAGVFYYVDKRMVADRAPATLRQAILDAVGTEQERPVIIRADAATPHQAVMTAMDAASRLGLLRFAFAATRSDTSR